jgi:hypothetical protein
MFPLIFINPENGTHPTPHSMGFLKKSAAYIWRWLRKINSGQYSNLGVRPAIKKKNTFGVALIRGSKKESLN